MSYFMTWFRIWVVFKSGALHVFHTEVMSTACWLQPCDINIPDRLLAERRGGSQGTAVPPGTIWGLSVAAAAGVVHGRVGKGGGHGGC